MRSLTLALAFCALGAVGCTTDIPQAHKGMEFDRTGLFNFYVGGDGLSGDVIGSGTYYTGLYDELRMVSCTETTVKETLGSLTKDNVQFSLDVYIRYSANCDDASVKKLLGTLTPDKGNVIKPEQLYTTYLRPAIGASVRETISPHRANDINEKREEILSEIQRRFYEDVKGLATLTVYAVELSNLDFPPELDEANTQRAVQAVLKDKAIAERDRVDAEIETAKRRRELAGAEGNVEAAKIDQVGAALRRNPEYVQLKIYEAAGSQGNLIITGGGSPNLLITSKK